jgi:thiol-disulfide isomerase/thioredoxin
MPNEIKTIEEFESLTKSKGVVLVHFWASWNKYDEILAEILRKLELNFGKSVKFCSLDTDQQHLLEFIKSLRIINLPALGYYKNGNKIALEIGMRTEEELQTKIEQFLNS